MLLSFGVRLATIARHAMKIQKEHVTQVSRVAPIRWRTPSGKVRQKPALSKRDRFAAIKSVAMSLLPINQNVRRCLPRRDSAINIFRPLTATFVAEWEGLLSSDSDRGRGFLSLSAWNRGSAGVPISRTTIGRCSQS